MIAERFSVYFTTFFSFFSLSSQMASLRHPVDPACTRPSSNMIAYFSINFNFEWLLRHVMYFPPLSTSAPPSFVFFFFLFLSFFLASSKTSDVRCRLDTFVTLAKNYEACANGSVPANLRAREVHFHYIQGYHTNWYLYMERKRAKKLLLRFHNNFRPWIVSCRQHASLTATW